MRKETKIGLFVIITIALAFWGYQFLRGFNILSKKTVLHAVYENVDGLRISTPVRINGLQVGLVSDFEQEENNFSKIKVSFNIDDGINVPKDAKAELVSSIMGGAEIHLTYDDPCNGPDCAQSGDYLEGITRSMLGSIATTEELSKYMAEVTEGLNTVIDTLSTRLANSEEMQKSITDARAILANLHSTTGRIDRLMAGSSASIEGSLKNVESITGNLKSNNEKISAIIASAEKLSKDLESVNMTELSGEVKKTMSQLQTTLKSSDKAINDLGIMLKSLGKEGDGAVAMLLHDPAFAAKLQSTVKDLNLLLEDIRLHPERYRRIFSKKEMPYEPPKD